MTTSTPTASALLDAIVRDRDSLRSARREYHVSIIAATNHGLTPKVIAFALNTAELYIANTIRLHREGTCGCSEHAAQG